MNRLTLRELAPVPGDHVLEVGFGGGDLLRALLDAEPAQLIGVDVSEPMRLRGRRRLAKEIASGRLHLLVGSAERLPLGDASFEKACSVNSLYFWPDLPAAMREFARVVKPGGRLALCFQTPEAVRNWPGHEHGFAAYDVEEVARAMECAAFGQPRAVYGSDRRVGEFVCLVSERS
jgi:ubiquinone/menaquinone biosynthesis C-methylase UbiE